MNPCRRPCPIVRLWNSRDAVLLRHRCPQRNDRTRPAAAPHTSTGHGIAAEPVHYLDHTALRILGPLAVLGVAGLAVFQGELPLAEAIAVSIFEPLGALAQTAVPRC